MNKKIKKVIIGTVSGLTLVSATFPSAVGVVQANDVTVVQEQAPEKFEIYNDTVHLDITENTKTDYGLSEQDQKIADAISDFYSFDEEGKIQFTATIQDLTSLGISERDAKLMIEDANEVQDSPLRARGFIGVHINLGPRVRSMNAWAAGAYAGANVAFALKAFAVTPHTAGVVGIISTGVGAAVRWAVQNRVRRVSVGTYRPGFAMSRTVSLP